MTLENANDEEARKARDGRRRNAIKHGLRAMIVGGTPKGAAYVIKCTNYFRRELEAVVVDAKGRISFTDACHVNTAARWERHALLAGRWLKLHAADMTHDQRLAYSRDIAKASESRDRAIAALKLDTDSGNVLDSLYGPKAKVTEVPDDTVGASDATL